MNQRYQLFAYELDTEARRGILVADTHYDLDLALETAGDSTLTRGTLDEIIKQWAAARPILEQLATELASQRVSPPPLSGIVFLSPVVAPGAIYAAGANYRDHVEAMARAFDMKLVLDPKREGIEPWHFIKPGRGTVLGHDAELPFPPRTEKLDWEAELAVVIGRSAVDVSVEDALDYVAGYTCANDLSARGNFVRDAVDPTSPFRFDWIGHKCFTGSCPLGPYITPAEFIDDPEHLDIKLWVNDELMQDSNTCNHLYGVADQISYLSQRLELFPGDIILTGTPAGVGMERGLFLKPGDEVRVSIAEIGELRTKLT